MYRAGGAIGAAGGLAVTGLAEPVGTVVAIGIAAAFVGALMVWRSISIRRTTTPQKASERGAAGR